MLSGYDILELRKDQIFGGFVLQKKSMEVLHVLFKRFVEVFIQTRFQVGGCRLLAEWTHAVAGAKVLEACAYPITVS